MFVRIPVMVVPFPFAGKPVRFETLSLLQVKTVPNTLLGLKLFTGIIASPEQIV
jgi:hypothetical protein